MLFLSENLGSTISIVIALGDHAFALRLWKKPDMDTVVHDIIIKLFPVFQPQILDIMAQVIWAQDVYYNLFLMRSSLAQLNLF